MPLALPVIPTRRISCDFALAEPVAHQRFDGMASVLRARCLACNGNVAPSSRLPVHSSWLCVFVRDWPPHPRPFSPKIWVTSLRTSKPRDRIVREKGAIAFAAFLHFLRSLFINVFV